MPSWILFFAAGVCYASCGTRLYLWYWLSSTLLLGALFVWQLVQRRNLKVLWFILSFTAGGSWLTLCAQQQLHWELPESLQQRKIEVVGKVVSIPQEQPRATSFEFVTKQIAGEPCRTKLKLNWYGAALQRPKIQPGECWQLWVKLKPPHSMLNPGGSDLEKTWMLQGIRAQGSVVTRASNLCLAKSPFWSLNALRSTLAKRITKALPESHLAGIVVALVTGYTGEIDRADWGILRDTGTNYLVAISGLHLGLVAGLIIWLARKVWQRSYYLMHLLPAPIAGRVLGAFFALLYAALTGFAIPVQRALIMLLIFGGSLWFRRKQSLLQGLLWALFFVLLLNPLVVLSVSFWLSFGAVAIIVYLQGNRVGHLNWWQTFWQLQCGITLGLLPLTLLFFQQVSLVAILASVVALPLICFGVVPLALIGSCGLVLYPAIGIYFLRLSELLLRIVWGWFDLLLAYLPGSWQHALSFGWEFCAVMIGCLLLLAPAGWYRKVLGVIFLLPLFFTRAVAPHLPGELWLTVLDVGQGLAVVLQTQHHTMLYDTGPQYFTDDAGSRVLLPFLREQHLKKCDLIMVSHGDLDHRGGLNTLVKHFPQTRVITSDPQSLTGVQAVRCFAGEHWEWDQVEFQVLAPPAQHSWDRNNASCVLQVKVGDKIVLLTGDIEALGEQNLLASGADLQAAILIAPHHGSSTSSTPRFIAAVQPQHVVFATGYKNHYHFPTQKVVARYRAADALMYNTPQTGALTFKINAKAVLQQPESYRLKIRKFWHHVDGLTL